MIQPIKKRILLLEDSSLAEKFCQLFETWGYEVSSISKSDGMLDQVKNDQPDVIILAKEMRVHGRPLYESPAQTREEKLLRLKEIVIDYVYGYKAFDVLRNKGIATPVIFTSTDDVQRSKWIRNNNRTLDRMIISNKSFSFSLIPRSGSFTLSVPIKMNGLGMN